MARVRRDGTAPELTLRSLLRRWRIRFRMNVRKLPGSPDIYVHSRSRAIFVHGCYWHRHPRCRSSTLPKTNSGFWRAKFAANIRRDQRKTRLLRAQGIGVSVIWECELENLRGLKKVEHRLRRLLCDPDEYPDRKRGTRQ
jgi:DNA mismatch endonuclease, patch repair protein